MFTCRLLCFLCVCGTLYTAGCGAPPAGLAGEEAAIRDLLLRQQADWNRGDIDAFMTGYMENDTLRFVGGSGEILGWHNTLQRYHHAYPDAAAMGTLSFDLRDIDVLAPDVAVVFGAYSLQRAADNPTGLFTLVLLKRQGRWRIVHDHTSADPG